MPRGFNEGCTPLRRSGCPDTARHPYYTDESVQAGIKNIVSSTLKFALYDVFAAAVADCDITLIHQICA